METTTKSWYQSKTIWGIIIAALGFVISEVLKVPDVQLPPNADFEQLKAYTEAVKAAEGNISVIISQIVSAIGTFLGIYGRITAEGKVS